MNLAGEEEENRVVELPDELIHEILIRLRPQKEAARAAILSKRWTNIWSFNIHPILEIDDTVLKSLSRFLAVADQKFSRLKTMEAVRIAISIPSQIESDDFVQPLFSLAAKFSPREIDIHLRIPLDSYQAYTAAPFFDARLPGCKQALSTACNLIIALSSPQNRKLLQHIQLLNLRNFRFFTDLPLAGSSLKVLCLENVRFFCHGCLKDMIAAANLLETLTLTSITGVVIFEIQNHQNLKSIVANDIDAKIFKVSIATSLETLRISNRNNFNLHISSVPNLKLLQIEGKDQRIIFACVSMKAF
ncbi:F-box/FBD/LRR-repeat protein At5g53840 [Linum perenne]